MKNSTSKAIMDFMMAWNKAKSIQYQIDTWRTTESEKTLILTLYNKEKHNIPVKQIVADAEGRLEH